MTTADIDAGLRLCRLSRWNQVARDWEQFLALTPDGATVATDLHGLVIGSVATMRYAAAGHASAQGSQGGSHAAPACLAWIAMVLVDPAHRGGGIGTRLLHHALTRVADADGVGLDATPLGQPLYEKLGFRTASSLLRMERPGADVAQKSTNVSRAEEPETTRARVRAATAEDLSAIARLDADATGLDRRAMLDWLRQGAPEFAHVSAEGGGIGGFVLGRHGHAFCHIGPVIASSPETASALVLACLRAHPARRFIVDIAEMRAGWRTQLEALGFTPQRPFARMYRGRRQPAERSERIHASIGPEFG